MQTSVPVLLYHHINYDDDVLSIPPELFEEHLKFLKSEGYVSITKEQLGEYLETGKKDWDKAVLITFDDGYLDTWVHAYPLLKKYGFNAILFLVTWTVEEDEFTGLNLEDYWSGKIPKERIPDCSSTYIKEHGCRIKMIRRLCWEEIRTMERSGIIDVQPHTKMHKKVYADSKIIGFNRPRDKHSAWQMVKGDERFGTPDFERKPELAAREFTADKELRDMLAKYVEDNGFVEFFKKPNWESELNQIVERYKKEKGSEEIGRFETEEEQASRIRMELEVAKGEVGYEVKKRCNAFSWPWGAYNDLSLKIAKEVGFKYLFTTKVGANSPGDSTYEIKRFGVWKKDLDWFKSRVRLYSNKMLAKTYSMVHRKI
ncbi:polysaccharide deacetylase family protein [Hippea alviniae]|uniref:polysaccharide deacetylase family protein n=1 Tax=Hippea alviniae TaxID=1279027 RepID=UPI0003B689FD|nr:polysaccharide deacetylase family protein [Hippea alviniae]